MTATDISVIITAHREGLLAGVSARSALAAVTHARANGLTCEFVVVLDNANVETGSILRHALSHESALFIESNHGDPGLSRNHGVDVASGRNCAFLDADDLWSENWLSASADMNKRRPDAILHSACIVDFGNNRGVWWHPDSELALCDLGYLDWMNCWDALSFLRSDLFRQYPMTANDMSLGYGHEDWLWNRETLDAGIPHKPVPGTIHFKRKRGGSQSLLVYEMAGVPWPRRENRSQSSAPTGPSADPQEL